MSGLDLHMRLTRPDFSLDVAAQLPARGITVVYGASGCGKTTLLRCVAGLEPLARGRVGLGDAVWQDDARGVRVPTHQRPIGYVFQEPSLFAHLDVAGNLAYGLRRSRAAQSVAPAASEQDEMGAAVALLGIEHLLHRRSDQLSGGERQRVAMARALATQPELLLLDEPLSSLDQARREEILPWLEKLRDEVRIPMLYVTHALDEVARLADTLLVMSDGRVTAQGPVAEVMADASVSQRLGDEAATLLAAHVQALDARWHLAQLAFEGGTLWVRDSGLQVGQAVRVRVLARDVSVTLHEATQTSIQNHLPCQVDALLSDGHPSQCLVRLRCGQAHLLARVTARAVHALGLAVGQTVWAQVKSVALVK